MELHKHEIWNECMTFLGINNANTDKRERLITNEVDSNNDLINYFPHNIKILFVFSSE